ncbi:unnamed protein product, partial [Symbiodinium sp. CCMP2456]
MRRIEDCGKQPLSTERRRKTRGLQPRSHAEQWEADVAEKWAENSLQREKEYVSSVRDAAEKRAATIHGVTGDRVQKSQELLSASKQQEQAVKLHFHRQLETKALHLRVRCLEALVAAQASEIARLTQELSDFGMPGRARSRTPARGRTARLSPPPEEEPRTPTKRGRPQLTEDAPTAHKTRRLCTSDDGNASQNGKEREAAVAAAKLPAAKAAATQITDFIVDPCALEHGSGTGPMQSAVSESGLAEATFSSGTAGEVASETATSQDKSSQGSQNLPALLLNKVAGVGRASAKADEAKPETEMQEVTGEVAETCAELTTATPPTVELKEVALESTPRDAAPNILVPAADLEVQSAPALDSETAVHMEADQPAVGRSPGRGPPLDLTGLVSTLFERAGHIPSFAEWMMAKEMLERATHDQSMLEAQFDELLVDLRLSMRERQEAEAAEEASAKQAAAAAADVVEAKNVPPAAVVRARPAE